MLRPSRRGSLSVAKSQRGEPPATSPRPRAAHNFHRHDRVAGPHLQILALDDVLVAAHSSSTGWRRRRRRRRRRTRRRRPPSRFSTRRTFRATFSDEQLCFPRRAPPEITFLSLFFYAFCSAAARSPLERVVKRRARVVGVWMCVRGGMG